MELDKYPFAEKYGWCEDKFGVSWQVILSSHKQKISPALLFVKEQSGKAEEAMKFYTSLFKNSKIESIANCHFLVKLYIPPSLGRMPLLCDSGLAHLSK